jgi:hypothetical protein
MKIKVSESNDEVEIGQWRPVDKGALRAYFSVVIYPHGQKILECKYFEQADKRWFSFPQKEIKSNTDKPEYIPLVSYLNKDYAHQLKIAVLTAIRELIQEQRSPNECAPIQSYPRTENQLPPESPFDSFPF